MVNQYANSGLETPISVQSSYIASDILPKISVNLIEE